MSNDTNLVTLPLLDQAHEVSVVFDGAAPQASGWFAPRGCDAFTPGDEVRVVTTHGLGSLEITAKITGANSRRVGETARETAYTFEGVARFIPLNLDPVDPRKLPVLASSYHDTIRMIFAAAAS